MKKNTARPLPKYISLSRSMSFLFSRKRLIGLSLLLFVATILVTWLGYHFALDFVDGITKNVFVQPPETASILGWLKFAGWWVMKWLYLVISRIVAFYLAFLAAYSITSPGYVLLSTSTEKLHAGDDFELDDGLSVRGVLLDLFEGIKIAGFGIIVTIAAILANFIPVIGQMVVFLLYAYYSALMFVDYPASRRRWSLGKKIGWLGRHSGHSLRMGLLPAFVSMIPLVNIFLMSLLFPFLTVHATLNFVSIESTSVPQKTGKHHAG